MPFDDKLIFVCEWILAITMAELLVLGVYISYVEKRT